MKHPALTRVFAIVLLIMSLILLTNGALGFGKAADERRENTAYCERLSVRIETYRELEERLNNSISYDDAYAELEKIQEKYNDEASQHRTDVAMHSATKGGYLNGAKTIYEAQDQIKIAKATLKEGKETFAAKETEFNQQLAQYNAAAPYLNGVIRPQAQAGAADCAAHKAPVSAAQTAFNAACRTPVEDPRPGKPVEPVLPPNATAQETADYNTALAEYNAAMLIYTPKETAFLEYEDWLTNDYPAILASADAAYGAGLGALGADAGALSTLVGSLPAELTAGMGGGGGIPSIGVTTLSGMTPSQASAAMSGLLQAFDGVAAGYAGIESGIDAYAAGIAQGQVAIDAARAELTKGETELAKAEGTLQYNLELIWLELSELEDDEAELADEKMALDKDSAIVSKKLTKADELKELEDKRKSTRILLTNVDEIGAMVDAGGDVIESSETYLAQRRADTERMYNGKMVICALAVISGVMGMLGLPAAFEKLKKRAFLILPVVFCLLCAAAADGVNMYMGLGQMYAALFTAIFALIQLLIILPKKKPGHE